MAADRDRGVSWEAVGDALDITRSAAHSRFADRLETIEHDIDAEQSLDVAWRRMRNLASKYLTPLIHGISELEQETRQHTSRNLLAAVMEPSFPAETRISAAQMLAILEHGDYSEALERLLQETTTHLASPQQIPAYRSDLQISGEAVSPSRLLDLSAWHARPSGQRDGEACSALISEAIQGFEARLRKLTADGADQSAPRHVQERLAVLLLIRFDELADPGDLEQAIQHLRAAHAASSPGSSEPAELLATALSRRYEHSHTPGDLAEAVTLLEEAVSDKGRVYGTDSLETFRVRYELAQSLVRSGDPGRGGQFLSELLRDQLRVLGPDHRDVLRTHDAYAMSLSDSGEHAEAEQILAELVTSQARVAGADHRDTTATRAHLLKVMTRRLTETGDSELIERLNLATWSVLTEGLTANREPRWTSPEGYEELPYLPRISLTSSQEDH